MAAILALPLSFTSHIDERLITGCWHFGAFTQLLDHVNDFEADRAKCRPTPLAENPFHGITPHEIAIRAKQHFAQAMHNFTPEQKPYFQALAILGKLYWNF